MDLSPLLLITLLSAGFISGIINTMAGGGSNLTLPALMLLGLPADAANATNRVGIIMQSIVGVIGFSRKGKMPTQDLKNILIPMLIGGLIGSLGASFFPAAYLKPALLITMVTMSLVILIRPGTVIPSPGETNKEVKGNTSAWLLLFFAGLYGGFVQAGVGFVLIAAIAGGLRYDLVRANALKVLCAAAFTAVSLVVFIWRDQIVWVPGLLLAVSTMAGAHIGVKLSMNVSQVFMKWFLFIMTLVASIAALI